MGNFVPLVPSAVVASVAAGLGCGVWSLGVGVLVAIPLISRFGFWENAKIRSELLALYPQDGLLVGIVFDRSADYLDAHAEIGLLSLGEQKLKIRTEDRTVETPLNSTTRISRQFNIHKLIGLGGWILIQNDGFPDLRIESREADTMFASKLKTDELFQHLHKEKGGSEEPPVSNQLA